MYVDTDATGAGDGTSWADAFPDLQAALTVAASGHEIWVAEGTYRPTPGLDRTATFQLQSGVAVYGGFSGNETQRYERNLLANLTILSGDIGIPGDKADNSFHVVTGSGTDATALLDGFAIMDGHADGANRDGSGGGMVNDGGSPTLTNVRFLGNTAVRGGALYNLNGHPTITNAVFSGNTASEEGGALYNEASDPVLTNITLSGNTAPNGPALYNLDSSPALTNSIVWGNAAPGGDPNATLECEREGYPCSYADVDPAVFNRGDELGTTLLDMLENDATLEEAVAWIETQPGVAEVLADQQNTALRFRLQGGRPILVYVAALPVPDAVEDGVETPLVPKTPHSSKTSDVVGDDPKNKHALVLNTIAFEEDVLGFSDRNIDHIAELLSNTRSYGGNVTYQVNTLSERQVGVNSFMGWGDHEVIYLYTHGMQVCGESGACHTELWSGDVHNISYNLIESSETGLGQAMFSIQYGPEGRLRRDNAVTITSDFMRAQYPGGLSGSMVFVAACKSYLGSDMAEAIGGTSSAYTGWSDTALGSRATAAYEALLTELSLKGVPLQASLNTVQEEGLNQHSFTHPRTGERLTPQLNSYSSGNNLRIREVAWIQNPLTKEDLPSAAPYPIVGQPEDGEPDKIPYMIKVDGVRGEPEGFIVHVTINGFSAEPKLLSEGEAIDGDGNVWRVKGEVPVPFDAQQGQEVDIEVRVDLPEGGESEWSETAVLGNPVLYFTSEIETVGGAPASRIYSQVKAEFELSLDEDFDTAKGKGTLEYLEYTVEVPIDECSVSTTTTDGTLRVIETVFPLEGDGFGTPSEVVLFPVNDISETYTVTCPQGSTTIETIHFFAAFVSFHGGAVCGGTNEFDESRGGLVITGWMPGSDDVIARKTYDRSCTSDDVTFTERTTIELRKPAVSL